jgi:hypothetical protein
MTVNEGRLDRIRQSARLSESGQFLLPRRSSFLSYGNSEKDRDWEACEELVHRGEATWLSASSTTTLELRSRSLLHEHRDARGPAERRSLKRCTS